MWVLLKRENARNVGINFLHLLFTEGQSVRIVRAHGSSSGCGSKAQVAELVDALVSGISGSNTVEVRVFSWAPISDLLTNQQDEKSSQLC